MAGRGQAGPDAPIPTNPCAPPSPPTRCCISLTGGGMPHSTWTPVSSSLLSSASQSGWLVSPAHTSTHPCSAHRFYYRTVVAAAHPHLLFLAQMGVEVGLMVQQQN